MASIITTAAKAPLSPLKSNCQTHKVRTPRTNFHADIWGQRIASIPFNQSEIEIYDRQIETLKKTVGSKFMDPLGDAVERIKLIDKLCLLGVSYHFEAEIEELLHKIFHSQLNLLEEKDCDLYTVAVVFRVFRQHGYKISCDVFRKFMDGDRSKFKESLTRDHKGMLSLFEAAHLSTHGEDILDEALSFTKAHLEALVIQSKPPHHLINQIISALKHPLHKATPRLKTREYISFFEEEDHDDRSWNETLLKFAKLDFNRVQLLHQQEMRKLLKWRDDVDFASKLPYGRDRIVEFYFWSVNLYYEPKYAYSRNVCSKIFHLITTMDDTYDTYGTVEELQILTDALKRWNRSVLNELPEDYIWKHLYLTYLDVFEELDKQAAQEGRSFAVSFTRDTVVELAKCYFIESQWTESGYLPSFEESYEKVGVTISGLDVVTAASFVGMEEFAGRNEYEWLGGDPEIIKATRIISQFNNNVASYKREEESGHVTSAVISCYKRQYNVSDKEAIEELLRRAQIAWKTVNEELIRQPRIVPFEILMRVLNFGRTVEVTYKDGDGVTEGKHLEGYIKTLFIDPIPISSE